MHDAPRFTMRPSSKLHREHLLLYVRVKSICGRSNEPPLVIICLDAVVSCDLILRLRLKLSLCSSNRSNLDWFMVYLIRGGVLCVFRKRRQKVKQCLVLLPCIYFYMRIIVLSILEDQTYKKKKRMERKERYRFQNLLIIFFLNFSRKRSR